MVASDHDDTLDRARALAAQNAAAALELLDEEIPRLDGGGVGLADPDLAVLFKLRAEVLRGLGQFERARADIERYATLSQSENDPAASGRVLFLLGTLEAEQGRLGNAVEYFHTARQRAEQGEDLALRSRIHNAIGVTLNFSGDQAGARPYFEQALELATEAGDQMMVASVLSNLAGVLTVLESPEAGIQRYREAIAIAAPLDRKTFVAVQQGSICQQLLALGALDEAGLYCAAALPVLEAAGEIRYLAGLLMVVGDLAAHRAQPAEALKFYQRSLETARGQVPTVEVEVLEKMAALQAAEMHWEAAAGTYQRLLAQRDRMRAQEREDVLRELEVAFQLERRDNEIEMLRLGGELQAVKIRERNVFALLLLTGLGLSLCAVAVAWRAYRVKAALEQRLATRNAELENALETISDLARRDSLTGLLNRRAMEEFGWQEIWRTRRHDTPIALVAADVDFFKRVNDTHGHVVGDEVLQQVAARVREIFRGTDLLSRWGGEEFVFLLPNSTTEEAVEAVERLRENLAVWPLQTSVGPIPLSMSFGVTDVAGDLDRAIVQADRAMYRAKHEGRDRVVVWSDDVS